MTLLFALAFWALIYSLVVVSILAGSFVTMLVRDWREDRDARRRINRYRHVTKVRL